MWQTSITWMLLLLAGMGHVSGQDPTCKPAWYPGGLWCLIGGYGIPGNFDANSFSHDVQEIKIEGPNNIAHSHVEPFPLRANLRAVYLKNFNNDPNAPIFPLNQLLFHNRPHVSDLVLGNVKLQILTATDFQGFSQLAVLSIRSCSLSVIDLNVFSELGVTSSGILLSPFEPKLHMLYITGEEALIDLDWGILSAVAESLKTVAIVENSITAENLTCSAQFQLIGANVNLGNNKLSYLPLAVLNTIQSGNLLINGNPFCAPNQDCSCCELADFTRWYRDVGRPNGVTAWGTCANANPAIHDHCFNFGSK